VPRPWLLLLVVVLVYMHAASWAMLLFAVLQLPPAR